VQGAAGTMSTDLRLIAAGAAVLGAAWWWAVHRKPHEDDDEVYTALFGAQASPVATPHGFVKILQRVPKGGRVLDIGIGSGVYLEHPPVRQLIVERELTVDGVDICDPSIVICQERIQKHGLEKHCSAVCKDARELETVGTYDAILFMESFPCMTKPLFVDIFRSVQRLLKREVGVTYLYHNLGDPKKLGTAGVLLGRILKPSVKLFLGVDFGRLTTLTEMDELVRAGAPSAPGFEDEILLSAACSEASIDLSGVSNRWHYCWAVVVRAVMMACGPRMEQHLITVRQRKAKE